MKIAVYGTLRKGKPLHDYLKDSKFLGEDWIEGYDLYVEVLPYAIKGEGRLKVEVYEVSRETFEKINSMEVNAAYNPVEVDTRFGTAVLREWTHDSSGVRVESGDFGDVWR
ncbi:MAG: gamma-glutamylcyclotransferase [Archaeoglobaceae archaeon]|nr:gamma-glutamylcyclotransferase [Archaeoglobaceae archaeon]